VLARCLSSSFTDCDEHGVEGGLEQAWRDIRGIFLLVDAVCGEFWLRTLHLCMRSNRWTESRPYLATTPFAPRYTGSIVRLPG
jgi:hypothetical protein